MAGTDDRNLSGEGESSCPASAVPLLFPAGRRTFWERAAAVSFPFFLLLACLTAAFLLFRNGAEITPLQALEIAKSSRDLSDFLVNETFIQSRGDVAAAPEVPGWGVGRLGEEGNYLVRFLYFDGKGRLKGWFFEVSPGSRTARRVTRSMGMLYSEAIDGAFAEATSSLPEESLVALRVKEARVGDRTVLEEISEEMKRTGVRKEYGWLTTPLGSGKWLVGFVYEPEGNPSGEKRGWVFRVDAAEPRPLSEDTETVSFVPGSREDLARLVSESEASPRGGISGPAEGEGTRLKEFLRQVTGSFGDTVSAARARFGEPLGTRTKTMSSIHDPSYKYAVTTLTYPGLELGYFSAADREFLISLSVTSREFEFGPGIRSGMPLAKVTDILGEPRVRFPDRVVYSEEEGFYELVFRLEKGDRVSAMKMLVYLD